MTHDEREHGPLTARKVSGGHGHGEPSRGLGIGALPELLSPDQLSIYLGIPLATVYGWRTRGEGPPGVRIGRHVRYRAEDVLGWLDGLGAHQ